MATSANSAESRDLAYFLHSFSFLPSLAEDGPLVLERGEGIHVYDNHGRKYIEGISGLWNTVVGFSEARLVTAATEQMKKLPSYHTFFGRAAGPAIDLAERLIQLAPPPMARAYFTNSGSEANETAIKMLWMINGATGRPQKRKIISRRLAYHGSTVATASLNGKDYIHAFGLPLPEVRYAECPHHWRYAEPDESEAAFASRLAANLEALIEDEGPETIAAFIAEPVMGAGGVILPPASYFEKIQAVLRRHDIRLIADEVVCGFGRTGRMWGSETYGIEPDIITTSKCMTAGYFPMGAVLISDRIDRALAQACRQYDEFPHGFTTAGHPVGCAVALETLSLITEGGLFDNLVAVSPHFLARLGAFAEHPLVGEARGVGLIGAFEIVADKDTKAPFAAEHLVTEGLCRRALRHGLILRPIGEAVIFAPPYIITEAQIDDMFDRVEQVMSEVAHEVAAKGMGPAPGDARAAATV